MIFSHYICPGCGKELLIRNVTDGETDNRERRFCPLCAWPTLGLDSCDRINVKGSFEYIVMPKRLDHDYAQVMGTTVDLAEDEHRAAAAPAKDGDPHVEISEEDLVDAIAQALAKARKMEVKTDES